MTWSPFLGCLGRGSTQSKLNVVHVMLSGQSALTGKLHADKALQVTLLFRSVCLSNGRSRQVQRTRQFRSSACITKQDSMMIHLKSPDCIFQCLWWSLKALPVNCFRPVSSALSQPVCHDSQLCYVTKAASSSAFRRSISGSAEAGSVRRCLLVAKLGTDLLVDAAAMYSGCKTFRSTHERLQLPICILEWILSDCLPHGICSKLSSKRL